MNRNEAVALLHQEVKTAATTIGREWADVIDSDDAEQELWLKMLDAGTNPQTGVDYIVEIAQQEVKIRTSLLLKFGHQIGMQYRDDYELFSGNYIYGTQEVREMLDKGALDGEAGDFADPDVPIWDLPAPIIEKLSKTDTDTATERIDLFLGMKRLLRKAKEDDKAETKPFDESYFYAIYKYYALGIPMNHETSTDSSRLSRGIRSLTREMNGAHRKRVADYVEGPGTRTVLTNVQAQKLTRSDYTR